MAGFVYIWRDRKRNKYYIGSHYGELNDGYVCSSVNMIKAYKKRPDDFKRRILFFSETINVKPLRQEEQKWLNLIQDTELGDKYYNLKKNAEGRGNYKASEETKRKMTLSKLGTRRTAHQKRNLNKRPQHFQPGYTPWNKGKTNIYSEETLKKISSGAKGRTPWNKGMPQSEEANRKQKETIRTKRDCDK